MSLDRAVPPMVILVGKARMFVGIKKLVARLVEKKVKKLLVRSLTIWLGFVLPRIKAVTSAASVELVKVPICNERLLLRGRPEEERGNRLGSKLTCNLPTIVWATPTVGPAARSDKKKVTQKTEPRVAKKSLLLGFWIKDAKAFDSFFTEVEPAAERWNFQRLLGLASNCHKPQALIGVMVFVMEMLQ